VAINRNAAPDGPYNSVKLGIAPTDADGVALTALNIDVDNNGSNDHAQAGSATGVRFGRLFVPNIYGTEKLDLTIPLEAQYWTGSFWARNTADTCTALGAANFAIGNYSPSLTSTNLGSSHISVGPNSGGLWTVTLAKPSPTATGAADIALVLESGSTGSVCPVWTPLATTGANLAYLQGQWCGASYNKDPDARITFGVTRNKFIFNRENY
jgi:MSHA biogenesis protein MshQ